ncbi:mRNA-binding ribosome synthesis protein nop7 [Balamuthia mandrillaris]
MGRERKKGASGTAAMYMTRTHAMKKLQVSLQDFRKLCILKGIYPRDPAKKFKGKDKTYYLTKDITFLLHDPLLKAFRDTRAYKRKIRRAKGKNESDTATRLIQNMPVTRLDHLVRERYPSFVDALRDMDDALCMIHLFRNLPQTTRVRESHIRRCARLCNEFQNYIVYTHSLRKVFISIKGIYYQAEVLGQLLTWLVPFNFSQEIPTDVDFRVMRTFLTFYETLTGFVLYKLYMDLGLHYPPELDGQLLQQGEYLGAIKLETTSAEKDAADSSTSTTSSSTASSRAEPSESGEDSRTRERAKALQEKLKTIEVKDDQEVEDDEEGEGEEEEEEEEQDDEDEEDENDEEAQERKRIQEELYEGIKNTDKRYTALFSNCHFWLSREVPQESLEFVIRSFGGQVSWEGCASGVTESDDSITHHLVDRPSQKHQFLSREYVQPQWVYDSANVGALLPVHEYLPGLPLPPHLSPFVDNELEGYTPKRQEELNALLGLSANNPQQPSEDSKAITRSAEQELAAMEEEYERGLKAELANEEKEEDGEEERVPLVLKPSVAGAKRKRRNAQQDDPAEEEQYAALMLSRKKKKLWDRIQHSTKKQQKTTQTLLKKRQMLEEQQQTGEAKPKTKSKATAATAAGNNNRRRKSANK